jgi:hypothetical protein
MLTVPHMLAVLLSTSLVQAATLHVTGYELQPHKQRALITAEVSLGYPVGDATAGLALDCRTGTVTILNLGTSMLGGVSFVSDGVKADPALSKALLASGLVKVKPGVLNVTGTGQGTLLSQCVQGRLDAAIADHRVSSQTRSIEVPIGSADAEPSPFLPDVLGYAAQNVTLRADLTTVNKQVKVENFSVGGTMGYITSFPTAQVAVSDGKALYPIYYNRGNQVNTSMTALTVPAVLTVYLTLDGNTWSKTTLNFQTSRVQTAPTSKPTLPIRP